jgi:hypothetical protein
LTQEQFEREIKELVETNAGRIALKELPAHLGVSIEIIEPTVMKFCATNQGEIVNGSIITKEYLDSIVQEVSELVLI